jgi:hypothetical protein
MLALPPIAPVSGRRLAARLARDHYVRLDSNDYSVHPSVIGRRIEVIADLQRVRALCEGRVVADHERVWAGTGLCTCAGRGSLSVEVTRQVPAVPG